MKNYYFILLIVFCLCSCNRHSLNHENLNGAEILSAQFVNSTEPVKRDMLIDSVSFVKLETANDCLIGVIDKILFVDDIMVVVDKNISKAVYLFDMNGRFLRQISRLGNGPHEYLTIKDVCITPNNEIAIYDIFKDKVLFFDTTGQYLKEQSMPYRFQQFEYIDSTAIIFNIIGYKEKRKYRNYTYVVTDQKFKDLYFFGNELPDIDFLRNRYVFSYNGTVYCSINFGNTLYQVGKDSIKAAYYLDFPDDVNKSQYSNTEEYLKLLETHTNFNDGFYELTDYIIYGCIVPYNGMQYFVYDRKTKESTLLNVREMFNPMLIYMWYLDAVYKDNTVVEIVKSTDIIANKESIYEEFVDDYPQLKDLYDGLNVDSNPVLFFYHINLKKK